MQRSDLFSSRLFTLLFLISLCAGSSLSAQIVPTNDPPVYGPYNVTSAQGGDGVHRKMVEKDTVLRAESPWTMYAWVQVDGAVTAPQLVAGYGDVAGSMRATWVRAGKADAVGGAGEFA